MGKGLSREVIVEAAAEAVRKNPFQQISVNELARTLGVKPASLYNHIASAEDIRTEVGLYAAGKLIRETGEAVSGKMPEDALMAFAKAYRAYERDNPGLYFYIIHLHDAEDSRLREAAAAIIQPIIEILSNYGLTPPQCCHWQRVFRSMMHGFIVQQRHGYFTTQPESSDQSYEIGIQCVIDGIKATAQESEGR